jgi:hypothetical protein
MFVKLCADDTPFVRRAAAQNLVSMIEKQHNVDGVSMSTAEGLADFIESFKNFARDDQVCGGITAAAATIAQLHSSLMLLSTGFHTHIGDPHRHRAAQAFNLGGKGPCPSLSLRPVR